ncbi:MAG: BON domain-containing protein [Planctomycetales bacterium]|nr:BON domain-containing protein [Planctomycetales bacterium]NIM08747.1 BON domain-containing protein [Planctomycetales bacterium]NIO34526.1 BON domain-containing protein [Planctomycetales bacterium]NIO46330.1 BON domain-containing protein [Planctomycetales bacterium]
MDPSITRVSLPLGDTIEERVRRDLAASPYLSLRCISCEYHEGVLTLCGDAPTYYVKQLAQTLALRTEGVDEVANRIRVATPLD